jgi:hypothetical protein
VRGGTARNMAASFADHHSEFRFIIQRRADPCRVEDFFAATDHGLRHFGEDDRHIGNGLACRMS